MHSGLLQGVLGWLLSAPGALVYLLLGLAAALENLVPPVPADVVVLFGAGLADRRGGSLPLLFLVVWGCNVGGALIVYAVGRRYGPGFFQGRWGQLLLRPGQLQSLAAFYGRYGFGVIFVSRFLPMFRAVVPVFAGISGVPLLRTAVPMAAASALWYGILVYLGGLMSRRWGDVLALLQSTGRWLWLLAGAVAIAVFLWWRRTR